MRPGGFTLLAFVVLVGAGTDALAGERTDRAVARMRALPEAIRSTPRRAKDATVRTARWAKANPKKALLLAAGTGAMIASAAVVGPAISDQVAQVLPDTTMGAIAATGIGGGVAGATRSLVVNGGMQMVQRKRMDYKELATDVGLSAVGGFFTLGVAEGVGAFNGGMSTAGKIATNFVAMGAAEGVKDTYQIAVRNKILGRKSPVLRTAWRVLPIEIMANALRLPSPTSFELKMVSDVVAAAGYHAIVNEKERGHGEETEAKAKAPPASSSAKRRR